MTTDLPHSLFLLITFITKLNVLLVLVYTLEEFSIKLCQSADFQLISHYTSKPEDGARASVSSVFLLYVQTFISV